MRLLPARNILTVLLLSAAAPAALLSPAPASAQLSVYDPANYAQNLLQAARSLEQINNQVRALQNQTTMLQNMARNLERIDFPQLQQVTSAMQRIDGLMGQARGIDFRVDQLDERVRRLFPGTVDRVLRSDQRVLQARARLDAATAGYRQAMAVQAQVVENVREDAGALAQIVARSQGAAGSLQAQQAANQLLALSISQQFQLQNLMAAEFRSESLDRSRRAQAEEDGRAATRRFLGSGRAYTRPRN
ncbi:MAG TPA: P-type conjugative transfer protein TrbJ [Allosphingosinicella sp.]|jgi:P-type conjugative transfer protein TrbJ|uniref:P-type conjugative transfer protein TrbJ n=1 Tax=Allosphingosinicella sp. TaxID=2823234 RepID=UPI002F2A9AD8